MCSLFPFFALLNAPTALLGHGVRGGGASRLCALYNAECASVLEQLLNVCFVCGVGVGNE